MFQKLKEEVERQGISMNRLALKSEISPSDLSSAVRGKKPMFPNWKKRISAVLDVPVEVLFEEDEEWSDGNE